VFEEKIVVTNDDDVTLEVLKQDAHFKTATFKETIDNYEILALNKEQILTLEYMQGLHTIPLISDEQLNKAVDGKTDKMTPDDLNSIIELIVSKDSENVSLGIKLFTQFNLSAMPLFTRLFLMMFNGIIATTRANTSVVYKNLVTLYPPQYLSDNMINRLFEALPIADDEEKALVTILLTRYVAPNLEKYVDDRNKLLKHVGLKYEYKIVDA